LKLNLGSGHDYKQGWVNVDVNHNVKADVYWDLRITPLPFNDSSVEVILLKHVLEHLTFNEAYCLLKDAYRMLKPNGKLHIMFPNLRLACQGYLEGKETLGVGTSEPLLLFYGSVPNNTRLDLEQNQTIWQVHKSGWDIEGPYKNNLLKLLEALGFETKVLKPQLLDELYVLAIKR